MLSLRLLRSLLALLVLAPLLSAYRPALPPSQRQVRELPTFTAVGLSTSITVIVRQGSPQQVVVDALPEDQAKLQTAVVGGQLRIHKTQLTDQSMLGKLRNQDVQFSGPVTVYVRVPVVQALTVSSSGQLQMDTLRGRELRLAVSGSGQLRAGWVQADRVRAALSSSGSLALRQLQADSLRATVSGSGSLTTAGACAYSELALSSSGQLNTADLAVQDCQVRSSGSGRTQVQVAHTLQARLTSSGNLLVRGNPQISSHVSGSGRVRQL